MEDVEVLMQDELKRLLHYNAETGIFTWKPRSVDMFRGNNPQRMCNIWNTRYANKEAGTIWIHKNSKTSYLRICITLNEKKKIYSAHRLAFLYTDGHLPHKDVDHIDGDGLNNRWINLRDATALENMKNRPMQSNNTSGTVGVCWHKVAQKWLVQIMVGRKNIHGGLFTNIDDAIARRKEMEIEYNFHKNHGRDEERKCLK